MIKLQVEIQRILKVLSNDIYDSPYALLRENVQNAYDAILMRIQRDMNFNNSKIEITLNDSMITISDNGIGMDEQTIENNYWKAGSSGKNNEDARKAGVVGTFGIGAMSNFGVCSHLKILTRPFGSETTFLSEADKSKLSVTEKCISLEPTLNSLSDFGTTVFASLEQEHSLNFEGAEKYLMPYVQYLETPVFLNGILLSQKNYHHLISNRADNVIKTSKKISTNDLSFTLEIIINNFNNGIARITVNEIYVKSEFIKGDIVLEQNKNLIFGLRNGFGLAAIPINTSFNFGGIANLTILIPTAGREAIGRSSIEFLSNLISIVEKNVAEEIAKYEIADSNKEFLCYVNNYGRFDLANEIKIQRRPNDERIPFKEISKNMDGKNTFYYSGSDEQIINQYASENTYLLLLSRENPRRAIQTNLLNKIGIEGISDNPRVLREYEAIESEEYALLFRLTSVLRDDYLITDSTVSFAEISHSLPNMIKYEDNALKIYISKSSESIQHVLKIYREEYGLFEGFVKDYVRNYLYQKISPYVPSSTKAGADALYKILQKNKELYTIGYDELGTIDTLLKDYSAGNLSIDEVFKASSRSQSSQIQIVKQSQIGSVESELPTITQAIESHIENSKDVCDSNIYLPLPPLRRMEDRTSCKVLKTDRQYPYLNNFSFFLGLSDNLFKKELDFFFEPHTTKVIWSTHKIIYIFTHASGRITLYYDIELKKKLPDDFTGGVTIPSTTIITKNRIFVPIVPEMNSYFDIKEGSIELLVRFDTIFQTNQE